MMDPHSRLSQFNQRAPKTRPYPPAARFMEPIPKPTLDSGLPKQPASTRPRKPSVGPIPLVRRPIATNARVKQDAQTRQDMHLAFVANALQQKALVRTPLPHALV